MHLELKMGNYFTFKGSIGRKQYLTALIFAFLFSFLGVLVSAGLGKAFPNSAVFIAYLIVFCVVTPATLMTVAAAVKRARDIGISLWWLALLLIPIANAAIGIYLLIAKGRNFQTLDQVTTNNITTPTAKKKPNEVTLDVFEKISQEIESGKVNKALWLKALVIAEGNEKQQQIKYAELRMKELAELSNEISSVNTHITSQQPLTQPQGGSNLENNSGNQPLAILFALILIIGALIWGSTYFKNTTSNNSQTASEATNNTQEIAAAPAPAPAPAASNQDYSLLLSAFPKATPSPVTQSQSSAISDVAKEIALAGITKDLLPNCTSPWVLKTVEEIVNEIDLIKNSNSKFVSAKGITEKVNSKSNAYEKRDCRGILVTATIDYSLSYRITWDNKEKNEWYVYTQISPLR